MMLDFTPLRNREMQIDKFSAGLKVDDLRRLTNEMVDTMLDLIDDASDADVIFVPEDPDADDPYAEDQNETNMPWTLGHVIVHTTASAEETAFIAAGLARGVPFNGRSRSEIPWQTITTISQCRARLEESRRMRLATLEVWPDHPYLDNYYQRNPKSPKINAIAYFVSGLNHDDSHLAQIAEIMRQAKIAQSTRVEKTV